MNAKNVKKRSLKAINESMKKFANVYQFCHGDTNNFVVLLRKGLYPHEYMDSWQRFNEI